MANPNPRSVPKIFLGFLVDPFQKVARIHRMNHKMGNREVFQLLSILDRIQIEVEYVGSLQAAVDSIREIFSEVRKFEKENGLMTPNYKPEGASK
jgi:hypothetical protein